MSFSNGVVKSDLPPATYKPFSLQHWSLLTIVKCAFEPEDFPWKGLKNCNSLINELKFLHRQGVPFLDLEFGLGPNPKIAIPLIQIIYDWEQRSRGTLCQRRRETSRYTLVYMNIEEDLKPFCSCRILRNGENCNCRIHLNGERWMNKKCVEGHKPDCLQREFRYAQ